MAYSYKEYTDPDGNKYRELPGIWNNCSPIYEDYVLQHGWTVQVIEVPDPEPPDETDFKAACTQFKTVCQMIGEFIGQDDFRGGFDEYTTFITSEAAQANQAQAALLASMWSGANEYCKYEGQKIGYGQPEWWYKCWEYLDSEQEQTENNEEETPTEE